MSKGNVFKLSGNMALGGGNDYGGVDIDQIKNSLKLLKAKKNQRQGGQEPTNNYGYGGSISSKNAGYQKQDYNYDALTKNHLPGSQKDTGQNYGSYNDYSDQKGYGNKRTTDPYQYSNKPPSYPQQNNNRNNRNNQQYPETYDEYPGYSDKKIGKSSTLQTKHTQQNSYTYSREEAPRQAPRQQPSRDMYEEPPRQQQRQQPMRQAPRDQYEPQPPRQQQRQPPKQQSRQEMQYYNEKEQKSIKQVNRENRAEIVEYNPADLKECDTCGRKFNPDSIAKHRKVCKKVFVQKRKQFNAQEQRIIDNNQKKLMKKGQMIEKKIQAQQKNQKLPKWKAQSLAFRAGLKQTRNQPLDPKEAAMIQQAQNEAGVKCPHCGRRFNDTAGPKHIKFCQEQAKKNMMKKKK